MGTTPVGFVTGATDLGMKAIPDSVGSYDTSSMVMSGGDAISLGDIVSAPDAAFGIVQNNFMYNYQAMAVQSIGIGLSFRLGKRLLRRPISNVNRNIFKPLGAGFKL